MRKTAISSSKGGGARGYGASLIWADIEKRIQDISGNSEAKLYHYFDYFAGTSTGGIMAILFALDTSASNVVKFYLHYLPKIFKKPWFQFLRRLVRPAYDNINLKKAFSEQLNGYKTTDLKRKIIIPVYTTDIEEPEVITNESHGVFELHELAGGTSAAPTFLQPYLADNESGEEFQWIDGGLTADNDPSWTSVVESGKPEKELIVISVGTGGLYGRADYSKSRKKGLIGLLGPLINRNMMIGNKKMVRRNMEKRFHDMKGTYFDFEWPLLLSKSAMDNVTPDQLRNIRNDVRSYIAHNGKKLERAAMLIVQNGTVE